MRDFIRQLLYTPDLYQGRRQAFTALILLIIAAVALASLPSALSTPDPVRTLMAYGIALTVMLLTYGIARRGHTRSAAVVLILGLYLFTTGLLLTFGGVRSTIIVTFIPLVVLSGVMLGRRALLFTTFLTTLTVIVTYVLGQSGQLPPPPWPNTPLSTTVQLVANLLTTGLIVFVGLSLVEDLLRQSNDRRRELKHTVQALQRTSVSQAYMDRIIRSMSNLLIVLEPDLRIRSVNPAAINLLGFAEDELVGQSFSLIATFETYDLVENWDHHAEDRTRSAELALLSSAGRRIPVSFNIAALFSNDPGSVEALVCVAQDISNIKAVEAERVRSAMRYRALFEQTNDAIFLLNMEGQHIAANQRAADLLGYSPDEMTTLSYREVVAEDELSGSDDVLNRLLQGETIPVFERRFRCKDGSTFPAEVSVMLVRDGDGIPLHIQSVVRDITRRKQYERELAYHASLLEYVSDAVISTDMHNVIQSWNRAAESVYGWEAGEVIGRKLQDVVPSHSDSGGDTLIKSQYIQRGHWNAEMVQQRRDGTEINVLSAVAVIKDRSGEAIGTVSVNHDITARKRAEQELEERVVQLAALRQIDVEISSSLDIDSVLQIALNAAYLLSDAEAGFILLKSEDGSLQLAQTIGGYANPQQIAENFNHGITARVMRQLAPELVLDVAHDPDYVPDLTSTRAMMSIPLISHERLIGVLSLETTDPARFTPEVFDYMNILTARIATALDNAHLYQVSQTQLKQLQTLYEQVSRLEQMKTDMIRIASHDLRNPIGIIRGYLSLIEMDILPRLDEMEAEFIHSITSSIDRMDRIINDILSLERIEQMARQDEYVAVDMAALTHTIIDTVAKHADDKQQTLIRDFEPDTPLIIAGHGAQLHEAMFNLAENAVKYTPPGKTITIRLRSAHGEAVFEVIDEGFGIPEDRQDRMFEPFYRAKQDEAADIEGTGLGLHLVKNIVERHSGRIIFKSVYREGSTFGFAIPLAQHLELPPNHDDSTQPARPSDTAASA